MPVFQLTSLIAAKFKIDPVLVAEADTFQFAFRQAALEFVVDLENKQMEEHQSKVRRARRR